MSLVDYSPNKYNPNLMILVGEQLTSDPETRFDSELAGQRIGD